MDKEQWKNEVFDSLRGMRRAEPGSFLFTRIEAAVARRIETVTPRQWKIALAFGILLLAINGWILLNDNRSGEAARNNAEFNNRYQLY